MIPTERASPRYRNIETWPTQDLVEAMVEAQITAVAACHEVTSSMVEAVDEAALRLKRGGRLIYMGAGTSGRLGALDAAELPPTFGWPAERAVAVMAGGKDAYFNAVEGAEDDGAAGVAALKDLNLNESDVVIGLAASGRTPFVVDALNHARTVGAYTIAIGNAPQGQIGREAECYLVAKTGAELIAGSTRMKAGTAQKVILTCLSTAIFVKLGFVYKGRMVDMRPTNEKLQKRATQMVAELADAPLDAAEAALAQSGGAIKAAILMLTLEISLPDAQARLNRAEGRLHEAMTSK